MKGTILESVGTYLTDNGMCYPIYADGSLDYENGGSLFDTDENDRTGDWFKGLSVNDQKTVNEMLKKVEVKKW